MGARAPVGSHYVCRRVRPRHFAHNGNRVHPQSCPVWDIPRLPPSRDVLYRAFFVSGAAPMTNTRLLADARLDTRLLGRPAGESNSLDSSRCRSCGAGIEYTGRGRPKIFCSAECRTASKVRPKPTKCAWCGLAVEQSNIGRPRKYCSADCRRIDFVVTREGELLEALRSMAASK